MDSGSYTMDNCDKLYDLSKRNIDPCVFDGRLFGYTMFPIMLGLSGHDEQASVRQLQGLGKAFVFMVPEAEYSWGAETYGADDGIDP